MKPAKNKIEIPLKLMELNNYKERRKKNGKD